LSSPAIQFKGSGFYITDYAKSGAPDKSSGSGAGKSTGDKSADKSDKSDKSGSTSTESSKPTESKSADTPAKPSKTGSE
jgi:predicted nucleic acid-binding Zn ribbon protein